MYDVRRPIGGAHSCVCVCQGTRHVPAPMYLCPFSTSGIGPLLGADGGTCWLKTEFGGDLVTGVGWTKGGIRGRAEWSSPEGGPGALAPRSTYLRDALGLVSCTWIPWFARLRAPPRMGLRGCNPAHLHDDQRMGCARGLGQRVA